MSDQASRVASVRRYVLYDEQRPSRAWMPTLEAVNDRFCQYIHAALLQTLSPDIEVTPPIAIQLIRHSELTGKFAAASHLTFAGLKPLRGTIVVAVDAPLIRWIVESRFGGDGRFPIAANNRELSVFEQKSAARLAQTALGQLAVAWKPIANLQPQIVRHEAVARTIAIARPGEQVIVSVFDMRVGQGGGKLTVCIPYPMLEPLHDQLVSETDKIAVDPDPRWQEALTLGIAQATMTLRVELTKLKVSVAELIALRPGSVFDIDRPENVTVEANGVPLFRGVWGKHGRKIGVRVEERLEPAGAVFTPRRPESNESRPDDKQ
jgi:flagellar motor switch protein FliM